MIEVSSIRDLIDAWPSRAVLAAEVSASADRVHKWALNGAIPARYHASVLRAAAARGWNLTADDLVRLHDRPAGGVAA